MADAATVDIAREVRDHLAGSALTERQAKLYSQRLRLDMGQDGLASFAPGDVDSYLDEAMLLLQCGLLERNASPRSAWRLSVKRAAEIMEWLSQSRLKPSGIPLHLLAAAAYQLADYPAMALGHLRRVPDAQPFSILLRELLRANFPGTIEAIRSFWQYRHSHAVDDFVDSADLTNYTFKHIVMCIGTVCAFLRTGNDGTVERALIKLDKLASSLVHSRDTYSYILALLTAASCRRFVATCLWPHVEQLRETSSDAASAALTQFARSAFVNRRALVWPAQAAGIERLRENDSFVLCTPTGSGKTTVATLAIVQGLFADVLVDQTDIAAPGSGNLILYLVPSRALAAEVESRLAQDLKGIATEPVLVTGLYGGIDWGPTDAWIQADRATIVVCTFEKADALLRYLGVLFLNRVRLVVLDEAHMVEQDPARLAGLEDGTSRSFRLEQLGARLLRARDAHRFRIIALSAVAASAAPALARWIATTSDAFPTTSSYRSTRQMLGHLDVTTTGQYTIHYDLMDGRSLRFNDEQRTNTPFVPNPFPRFPGRISDDAGPEVRMRGPTLWAALQLATARPDGSTPSVLISVTQGIEAFSATCADLIDSWPENTLPNYQSIDVNDDLWSKCLASAEDYFTIQSVEYRLLRRGIAVHHGKMPGLLARRLKVMIDRGYVRVIIATSTLSEGVNIPVNFLLIPSVYRGTNLLSLQEFTNLIGRAGRPGITTEGSTLVVLPERTMTSDRFRRARHSRQWDGYLALVDKIEETTTASESTPEDEASSPLALLLYELESAWAKLTGSGSAEEFTAWLEQTAVVDNDGHDNPAFNYLDSLDAFLIAAIQEVEEIRHSELAPDQVETELIAIWQRTYAFASSHAETWLASTWLTRGRVIKTKYPDATQRRQIYKTSLSPRSAINLLDITETVRIKLNEGASYAQWVPEERFTFIRDVLALLSQVSSFRITNNLGRSRNFQDWPKLLRWWLAKTTLSRQPAAKEITNWYEFVAQNFVYRGTWGLGSIIGLLMEGADDGIPIRPLEMGDWPRSGLPWIAFWMKELITWGTLDPVAAFLLARGDAIDRPSAEADARSYYEGLSADADPNEVLDPRQIRDWVGRRHVRSRDTSSTAGFMISAELVQPVTNYLCSHLSILPIDDGDTLIWIDPAGYTVARSERPYNWPEMPSIFEFDLNIREAVINGKTYFRESNSLVPF